MESPARPPLTTDDRRPTTVRRLPDPPGRPDRRRRGDRAACGGGQPVLQHVVGRPVPERLDGQLLAEGAGQEDERHARLPLPRQPQGGRPVERRQQVVGQDHVRPGVDGGGEVGGRLHPRQLVRQAGLVQRRRRQLRVERAVLQQQDADRCFGHAVLSIGVGPAGRTGPPPQGCPRPAPPAVSPPSGRTRRPRRPVCRRTRPAAPASPPRSPTSGRRTASARPRPGSPRPARATPAGPARPRPGR